MSVCKDTGRALWLRPKQLGEEVRIVDPFAFAFDQVGHKFANRITDEKVLVYFLKTKVRGYVQEYDWAQCKRIEGGKNNGGI